MASGLFILLKDLESLKNCVKYGFYGFLMPPIYSEEPPTRSKHYAVLSDYACCEKGTEIFFFTRRTITYGGTIINENSNSPTFYLNGNTSPIGRKANSELYLTAEKIYDENNSEKNNKGIYYLGKNQRNEDIIRAMPFIIEFDNTSELTGKQIVSDELYFELGNYNFPFPSNTIQEKGMCTLTPKETKILKELMKDSNEKLDITTTEKTVQINAPKKTIFNNKFIITDKFSNESHLEFYLLANKLFLNEILSKAYPEIKNNKFYKGRQIPLCPFKPIQFDAADICLYSYENPIIENSLPNIIIELKNDTANFRAYEQVTKYLRWIKQCAPEEFNKVKALIIAPNFRSNLNKNTLIERNITLEFNDKIKLYSLDTGDITTVK